MPDPSAERREVHYSGHVQGVGFRFTACQIASRYRVKGFVRNLPDGRVELVSEGEPRELDSFLAAIGARMSGHIRSTTVDIQPARNEFSDFSTRH